MIHRSPRGRAAITLASLLYGLFILGAFTWSYISGPGPCVVDPARATWQRTSVGIAGGLLLGLAVVGGSRLMARRLAWARQLERWFAEVLGPLSAGQALILALLSALGEELLFRGAMQPTLGLWLTGALFGLAHFPPHRRLVPWTIMALILGLLFGAITLWSGSVAGAVVAHFTINLLNLRWITREKLPPPDRPPSMGHHDHDPDRDSPPPPRSAAGGTDPAHLDLSGHVGPGAPGAGR